MGDLLSVLFGGSISISIEFSPLDPFRCGRLGVFDFSTLRFEGLLNIGFNALVFCNSSIDKGESKSNVSSFVPSRCT